MTLAEFILAREGEEWRPVPGYESTYLVSSHGRVASIPRPRTKGGLCKQKIAKRGGYPTVSLIQGGKQRTRYVHALVAEAFIGPRPEGMDVRHLDGNPLRPELANLAYGTRSQNNRDKVAHGTDHHASKTHCPQGHPYSGDNLLTVPSRPGTRYCKTCNRTRSKRRYDPDYRAEWAA